jgi:hypothetical protein
VKLPLLAVFTIVSCGALTGVITVLEQLLLAGQDGSPPPETVAVFVSVVPFAAAVGVTGIAKAAELPVASPAAIVHVTAWPLAVQPPGNVPMVSVPGILSVTVAVAVVGAVPVFVTVSV